MVSGCFRSFQPPCDAEQLRSSPFGALCLDLSAELDIGHLALEKERTAGQITINHPSFMLRIN